MLLHEFGVINMQGLRNFQLMLMFFAQIKNFEGILFFLKYLMN